MEEVRRWKHAAYDGDINLPTMIRPREGRQGYIHPYDNEAPPAGVLAVTRTYYTSDDITRASCP